MKDQMTEKIFILEEQVKKLTERVEELESKLEYNTAIQRNHLIRVKNGEELDDHIIATGRPYTDLSPICAHEIINDPDSDYLLLDVSRLDFKDRVDFPSSLKIPLEDLGHETDKLPSTSMSILVISENGLRSIKACELLADLGYFNINNVSGGFEHWPR